MYDGGHLMVVGVTGQTILREIACSIYDVHVPQWLVVIHIGNQHSLARQIFIPSAACPVLDDVKFIFMPLVVDDEALAPLTHRSHGSDGSVAQQFGGLIPTTEHLFQGVVAQRLETASSVIAARHDIPVAHTVVAAIENVVGIGQSQAMGELVAHGSDTGNMSFAVHLVGASV